MAFDNPGRQECLQEPRCRPKNNRSGLLLIPRAGGTVQRIAEHPSRHRPNRLLKCGQIAALAPATMLERRQQSRARCACDSPMNLRTRPFFYCLWATEIREANIHERRESR